MTKWLVAGMIGLIVVAHVFLWGSAMPTEAKLTFTTLNAIGWTIVFAPIFLVNRWLDSTRRRNREE